MCILTQLYEESNLMLLAEIMIFPQSQSTQLIIGLCELILSEPY